jgi:uncharacterized RDD family membrane protein YckC
MMQQDGTGQGRGVPGTGIAGADAAQPDAALPDAAQPEAAQPDAAQPDTAQAGAPEPGAAPAGAEQNSAEQPGAAPAGAVQTGSAPADGSGQPGYPSPHLDGGAAIPEAYLAPPQQDQPRYGVPTFSRSPLGDPRFQAPGGPGYGQPGYGQPGYGRPGYRQPGRRGTGRPGAGGRIARDPSAATPWQRLTAACLDWVLILLVATAIFFRPLLHLWRQMQAIANTFPDLNAPAAQTAINNVAGQPANQRLLLYWFLAIFGLALAYFWVQHAAWGATVGKRLLGTRVVTAADQTRIGVRAAGIRAVAVIAGPMLFLLLANPLNLIGGAFWVADTVMALMDRRLRSLHDIVAGTVVVQEKWLTERRRSSNW